MITIVGIEVTQGIQFFDLNGQGSGYAADNSLALVSQKKTLVRVYAAKGPPPPGPPGRPPTRMVPLTGTLTYRPMGSAARGKTIRPLLRNVEARAAEALERNEFRHSLNFLIPAIDCQGTVGLTATVFDDTGENEPTVAAAARATQTQRAAFTPVPAFRIHPVRIRYTGNGLDLPAPSVSDFAVRLEGVISQFPIAGIQIGDCLEYTYDGDLTEPGDECGAGWADLLDRLDDLRLDGDPTAVYVGLLPTGTPSQNRVAGCGRTGVAAVQSSAPFFAHEVAHTLGRLHAPCGGPANPDPDYPDYGSGNGTIGEHAVDMTGFGVYRPSAPDIMSYCTVGRRVSPYTFDGLRTAMIDRWGAPGDRDRSAAAAAAPQELLRLRFDVRDDAVTLRSGYRRRGRLFRQPGRKTPVNVELVGAGGVLAEHECLLISPRQDPDDAFLSFAESVPWVPGARSVVVRRAGRPIGEWPAPDAADELRAPATPTFDAASGVLQWDTGRLAAAGARYQVEFSNDDGRTWQVLAHPRQPRLHVDLRRLPGGERCRLRVVSWDGTVVAGPARESAPTPSFATPAKPRRAHVLAPRPGRIVDGPVLLRGGGYAPGLGLADGAESEWSSEMDGPLGCGHELLATLTPGRHTVTLTVPDGLGGRASATVVVNVAAPDG